MNYAILCPIGIESEVIAQRIIGGNFVRGQSGRVYVAGYWTNGREIPDSETHVNISAAQLTPEMVAQIPTLNKSIAISGIEKPIEFMEQIGMVRCNADGSDLETEE